MVTFFHCYLSLLTNRNPREQDFQVRAKHFPTQISHLIQVFKANFHARDFGVSGASCITIDSCIVTDSGQCTFLLEKLHKVNKCRKIG